MIQKEDAETRLPRTVHESDPRSEAARETTRPRPGRAIEHVAAAITNEALIEEKFMARILIQARPTVALTLYLQGSINYLKSLTDAVTEKGHSPPPTAGGRTVFNPLRGDCPETIPGRNEVVDLIRAKQGATRQEPIEGVVFRSHLVRTHKGVTSRVPVSEKPLQVAETGEPLIRTTYYCGGGQYWRDPIQGEDKDFSVSFELPLKRAYSLKLLLEHKPFIVRDLAERMVLDYGLSETAWNRGSAVNGAPPLKPPYEALYTIPEVISTSKPYVTEIR